MRIQAWDAEFVRATRQQVHPLLRDLPAYGRWWPGTESQGGRDEVTLRYTPPRLGGRLRRRRLLLTVTMDRPDLGMRFSARGDLVGDTEWYYLDEHEGCVVHHLAHVDVDDARWRTTLADLRAWVRVGLHQLKDRLEAGRAPGSEPDARLLDAQARAIAARRERVEEHRRASASPPASAGDEDVAEQG